MRINTVKRLFFIILLLVAAFPLSALSEYQDDITKSFDVQQNGTLKVKSDIGSIKVTTGKKETVDIKIHRRIETSNKDLEDEILEALEITMSKEDNDVYVEIDYRNDGYGFSGFFELFTNHRNKLRIEIEIAIPNKYNVDLKTSGGSITIEDLEGYAKCSTSGGSIKLENIEGPVNASTSGGSIRLVNAYGDAYLRSSGGGITTKNIFGDIDVHTSGGSIRIGDVTGNVEADTSGGGIEIGEISGNINASTSGGSISAGLYNQITENCRLTSSGGSISLYINPECRFSINAQTSSGGVRVDFPVTITGKLDKNRLNADINGGGPEIYIRTSGGNINLKRI